MKKARKNFNKKLIEAKLKELHDAQCVESEDILSCNSNAERLVKENLKRFDRAQPVKSDKALLYKSDTSSLSKHNKQYTALLKAYVESFKYNLENNKKNKEDLFKIAKGLLIFIPIFTILFMFTTLYCLSCNKIDVWESLPGMLTALTSLIGTFMVIPHMITEYLFNKEEEAHLANIISKIQEYDRDIRGSL